MPCSWLRAAIRLNLSVRPQKQMSAYLWVGLGGFLGSIARYSVALLVPASATSRFPTATFIVNCLGCLLIGLLAGLSTRMSIPEHVRVFLITGILGGFTTFSAFGLESVNLLRRGEFGFALLYVLGSVFVGLLAVWLGFRFASAAEA